MLAGLSPNTFPETLPKVEPRITIKFTASALRFRFKSATTSASLSAINYFVDMTPREMAWHLDEESSKEKLKTKRLLYCALQTAILLHTRVRVVALGESGWSLIRTVTGEAR